MKKTLLLTLPLAAALLAPAAAQAYPHCRDYQRTIISNGFYREEYGTTCLNRWGAWDYFPRGFNDPFVQNVSYFDSPVGYYQQPSTVFAFSFSDNNRRGRDWNRHNWNRNDRHDRYDHDGWRGRHH